LFVNIHSFSSPGIEAVIISIVASNPTQNHLYGLDRAMHFYRSDDHGATWEAISTKHFKEIRQKYALIMARGVPENVTSSNPPSSLSVISSNGIKWGGAITPFVYLKNQSETILLHTVTSAILKGNQAIA
jgi:hypothetical protein